MVKSKSADRSIGDTISELAAALAITRDFPEWPEKLEAFNDEEDLSCKDVGLKVVADLVETADSFAADAKVVASAVSGSEVFATYLANFVQVLFAIAKESEDKDGVDQLAVEVLLCIVEEEKLRTCMSIPEFATELVPILLELRLKVENDDESVDEEDAESKAESDSEEEEDSLRCFSAKAFDRVASKIGEENVKEIIFGYALEYLKKDEWRYNLVGLKAISETIEYLPGEGVETLLDEIVEILKVQLNEAHQRVRPSTCLTITVLCSKCPALFKENHVEEFKPLLANLLKDFFFSGDFSSSGNTFSDLQINALCSLVVCNDLCGETEGLMPYTDAVVKNFLEQVNPENPRKMREKCIGTVDNVAFVMGKKFMKYYSVVVPVLKKIIVAPSTDEEGAIREAAIDCFDTIKVSAGDEMIQADADEVALVLLRQK